MNNEFSNKNLTLEGHTRIVGLYVWQNIGVTGVIGAFGACVANMLEEGIAEGARSSDADCADIEQ